jgi:iron uptake system component EfeO
VLSRTWSRTRRRRAGREPGPIGTPRVRRIAVGWLAAGAAATALVSGCGGQRPANQIMVSTGSCGTGWQHPKPGMHTFQIYNGGTAGAEVDLINPASGAIYGEVEALGPQTTRPMRVDIGSGNYAFRCLIADTDPITGPVTRIGGDVTGSPAIIPVTNDDMLAPASEYHAYVTAGLKVLTRQADQVQADIDRGDLTAAKSAWLPAHLTYERLGAAYGTFGDFDGEIDGTAYGLPGGVSSPDFTGFYRVEYGLYHGQSSRELRGPAARLDHAVRGLRAAFPSQEVDLLDVGLRTHEILENALQFQLTGLDDYGSGTTLATTAANITGTRELLQVLRPLLVVRYKALPVVYTDLNRLQQLVEAQRLPGGHWVAVAGLSTIKRQQIDAAAGQALEALAPIAVITEPRRT